MKRDLSEILDKSKRLRIDIKQAVINALQDKSEGYYLDWVDKNYAEVFVPEVERLIGKIWLFSSIEEKIFPFSYWCNDGYLESLLSNLFDSIIIPLHRSTSQNSTQNSDLILKSGMPDEYGEYGFLFSNGQIMDGLYSSFPHPHQDCVVKVCQDIENEMFGYIKCDRVLGYLVRNE